MEALGRLAEMHLASDFYLSTLLIAQSIRSDDPRVHYMVLKALHGLGHCGKVQEIVGRRPELRQYHEIELLYIRSGRDADAHEPVLHTPPGPGGPGFAERSLRCFYTALNKKEKVRKRYLVEAFQADSRNIEPLVYLLKETLCTAQEIKRLIGDARQSGPLGLAEYRVFLEEAFQVTGSHGAPAIRRREVFCPLSLHLETASLYKNRQLDELFRAAVRNVEHFPESEFSYEALGLYYLAKERYREARGCFLKTVEINKYFGMGHLYCGIIQSILRETEKAVPMLSTAYSIMDGSYLPAYFLAYEYQQMNNFSKAKYYYKNCVGTIEADIAARSADTGADEGPAPPAGQEEDSPHPESADFCAKKSKTGAAGGPSRGAGAFAGRCSRAEAEIISSAVYCLINNEDYDLAMEYLDAFGIRNLLRVYCLLFTGALEEAKDAIAGCKRDCFYHASRGYLLHLVDDFEGAVKEYEKCAAHRKIQVVENLMAMVLENMAGAESNHAFDYSNCLFDSLEFRQRRLYLFG